MRRWSTAVAVLLIVLLAQVAVAESPAAPADQQTFPAAISLTTPNDRPSEPHLALDARNVLHAFWWDDNPPNHVYQRTQLAGGGWSPPDRLSAGQESVVIHSLRVVRNAAGEACVFWTGLKAGSLDLYMACTQPGGMTDATTVAQGSGHVPAIAADGSVVTVYVQGAGDLYLHAPQAGADQPLAGPVTGNGAGLAGWHDFVISRDGGYHVAWVQLPAQAGAPNVVYYRGSSDGGRNWQPALALSSADSEPNAADLSLVADGQNRVHVAWLSDSAVYYRQQDAGGNWGAVAKIPAGDGGISSTSVGLQVDASGLAQVVWQGPFVRYSRQVAGGGWTDGQVIAAATTGGSGPALVVRPDGQRDFLWRAAADPPALEYAWLPASGNALPPAPAPAARATPPPAGENLRSLPGIPLPTQVSTDPAVVGVNLLLALLSAVFFGLTTSVFNGILSAHADEIREWLAKLTPAPLRRATEQTAGQPWWRALLFWIGTLALTALIQSFLDPSPLFSGARLHVFLAIGAAALIVAAVEKIADIVLRVRLRTGRLLQARTYGYGILLAVVSVAFSRLMGFQPGYLVGIVGVLALLPEVEEGPRAARRALGVMLALFVFGLLAWGLAIPLQGIADLQALALMVFVLCLQGVAFSLIPLSIFDGSAIWHWRKPIWLAFFGGAMFVFYHVLVNPSLSDATALRQNSLRTLLIVMAVYGLATLALWIVLPFRAQLRQRGGSPPPGS